MTEISTIKHTKEVYYDQWCKKCKFMDNIEIEEPCNSCLEQGWNIDSHKPIHFEEQE